MERVEWQMSDRTIVRKVEQEPTQATFEPPHLTRVKQGERMVFDAHVDIEPLPEGRHLKKATIFSNVPNGGTWEVVSDEGTAVGGRGTAPSPLMYFAAGLGLCFMSHVEMLAKRVELPIGSVRLEQRSRFSTTLDLGAVDPASVLGKGERMELHLMIESPAEPERLETFMGWCRQACMALQTMAAATPVETVLFLNGTRV